MAQQQARRAAVHQESGEFKHTWFTVETEDGNAVAGADRVFDHDTEADATQALQHLIHEVGKPLAVVRYSRQEVAKYAAVTRIEKVEPEKREANSR